MGFWDDMFGENTQETNTQNTFEQAPEYAEASGARSSMYGKLKGWENEPGYGAIPSNWDDLWNQSRKRTSQYFWGSPTTTGVRGKMAASDAAANRSGQPASMRSMARMGATEAGMLTDIATQQAYAQAQESEKGRQNWLSSMFGLAQLKPQMLQTGQKTTQTSGGGEGWGLLSSLGGLGLSLLGGGGMGAATSMLGGGGTLDPYSVAQAKGYMPGGGSTTDYFSRMMPGYPGANDGWDAKWGNTPILDLGAAKTAFDR